MKTTTTTNPSASQAISTWKAAQDRLAAALTIARRAAAACSNDPSPETRLAKVVAEREALEAEDDERRARAVASWACDARDLAAAEPAAVACSLEGLSADLEAEGKEAARLRAELAARDARVLARIAAAREGEASLTAKRDLAGEPAPRRIPTDGPLETRLAAALTAGPVPAKNHAGRIKTLRNEETSLRVSLEKAHREAEQAKKDREEAKAAKKRDEEARRKREQDDAAAWRAKGAAERDEREALAAAHASRPGAA